MLAPNARLMASLLTAAFALLLGVAAGGLTGSPAGSVGRFTSWVPGFKPLRDAYYSRVRGVGAEVALRRHGLGGEKA